MIDTHCHIQDDKNPIIKKRGLYICNGHSLETSIKAVEIANSNPQIFAAVGLGYDPQTQPLDKLKINLEQLAVSRRVVAIGECGLDEKDIQIELFEFHLQLAGKLNLPVSIHSRGALPQIYDTFKRIGFNPIRIQMHCWTGDWQWAKKFLDLGSYLSFGGIVTFKKSDELRDVIKKTPIDRILLETDLPYLSPSLEQVAKVVADVKDISIQELDETTAANAYALFPKLKLSNLT